MNWASILINIKLLIVICILPVSGIFTPAKAQQDPMYSQYMFNSLSINPAYAGTREMLSLMLLARQQWVGFDGAPSTGTFSAHSPIYNGMAAGASVIYDSYGPVKQTSFYIDYAYHLKMNETLKLSMGLKGGFNHYAVDYNSLDRTSNMDNAYASSVEQTMLPNFGFGLYLYSPKFYVGLSVPKLMENKYEDESDSYGEGKEVRHYYSMAGTVFKMNEWFVLKPSVMTRLAEGSPFSIDFNLNSIFYDKLWLGAMYRLDDSFGGIAQYQFTPQFKVGYAFDLNTNALSSYHSGTHEVMIHYEFNFKKEKILNPRYF
ncbi:type IX secretion system membrane protein PorP/SprF [Labilibacter sediminis]|nr:type IX secretion system membrane protein PorP/SprF [Labilibacter sediminis]